MMGKFVGVCGVLAVVFAVAMYLLLSYKVQAPEVAEDGWWGDGEKRTRPDDTSIRSLPPINVSTSVLTDLTQRLMRTRFTIDLHNTDFSYGFQAAYMREVVDYWQNKYNWRKQEQILNSFSHYMTEIEGLGVHYMHVKPQAAGKAGIPLLLVHGWPGSVWEFYKLLPLLTGSKDGINFEVIAPSIPGYGYSKAPRQKGFDQVASARVFMKLMKRIGFDRYFVQGGDWGSLVTQIMAIAYPQNVIGIHNNMIAPPPLPKTYLKQVVGWLLPSLIYQPGEADVVYPVFAKMKDLLVETGYFHLQATKPDTIGMALTDSPVGLAAYILEKFSSWTDKSYRSLPDGGLTKMYTMDELLTNVMIYWTNRNIVSSMRYYREYMYSETAQEFTLVEIHVPAGLAQFPQEMIVTPRTLAADKFTQIVQFTVMPRGGHFAALEQPVLLADDIRAFATKVLTKRPTK